MNSKHLSGISALFLLVLLLAGMVSSTAEATSSCRISKGGFSADALGEEFPEFTSVPLLLGWEYRILDLLTVWCDDGLGEEFPEKAVASTGTKDALGEEFPE